MLKLNELEELLVEQLSYSYIEGNASQQLEEAIAEEYEYFELNENEVNLFNVRIATIDKCIEWAKKYSDFTEDEFEKFVHEAIVNVAPSQEVYEDYFNKYIS